MKNEIATVSDQVTDIILSDYLTAFGIGVKLNDNEKTQFLNIAKTFGLNPFKREIHVSKYGETLSIITGYEVYIKRAERSGQLNGWNATTTGSVSTGDLKAIVTIYRKDREHPFIWEVFYDECVQVTDEWENGKKTGKKRPTSFWLKANFMTKKVAISQAFRLCFSDELAGMPYTSDEMPEQTTEDITHEVVSTMKAELVDEAKPIPALNDKQYKKLIDTADISGLEKALNGIEECLITATPAQVIGLEDLLTNLRNQTNE